MERVKHYREAHFMSQLDLAKAAGVGISTISRIEHGTMNPRPSTLKKIARALGVQPQELLSYIPGPGQRLHCQQRLYDTITWRHRWCANPAIVIRDGIPYCRMHDPQKAPRR